MAHTFLRIVQLSHSVMHSPVAYHGGEPLFSSMSVEVGAELTAEV